ncbi:MAG TPA: cupin domain-containing protein [Cytophagales bacterium]|nr:cupin domain-containing protein [Cytophagales bacterium]HAA19826.1 cupin domain-containing protein [Cytophagales bacterium]HAP58285.1 cupin domain-containing protein [Cytophagales bacterium]
MALHELASLPVREVMPGFHGRFVHTPTLTMAYWDINPGASLPEHQHPHEQVVNVLEGQFELTVAGEPILLEAGKVFTIPGDTPHSGRAITPCRILDIFHPAREDYQEDT